MRHSGFSDHIRRYYSTWPRAIYIQMQFKNTHVTFSFLAKLTRCYAGTHELHCVYDIQLKDALANGPQLSVFDLTYLT